MISFNEIEDLAFQQQRTAKFVAKISRMFNQTKILFTRDPWSSGYWRQLMLKRSWV